MKFGRDRQVPYHISGSCWRDARSEAGPAYRQESCQDNCLAFRIRHVRY